MNPAALITNLKDLLPGGLIIADADAFTDKNLVRAGYKENPLEDGSLDGYRLISIDITKQVIASVEPYGLSTSLRFVVRICGRSDSSCGYLIETERSPLIT